MGIIKSSLYKLASPMSIRSFTKRSFSPYYHLVSDVAVPHISGLYSFKNEKQFERHIDFFLNNYKSLTLQDITTSIQKNGKLPQNSFFLNFDDGLSEVYHIIRPVLKRKGVEAAFFICKNYTDNKELFYKHKISLIIEKLNSNQLSDATAFEIRKLINADQKNKDLRKCISSIGFKSIDKLDKIGTLIEIDFNDYLKKKQPYLTRVQVNDMIDDGFYFGGHTTNHYPLNELTVDEQFNEIVSSIDFVKQQFKVDYSIFSFPFNDKPLKKELFKKLFEYNHGLILFGNSGIMKDIDSRIIQRIPLEKAGDNVEKYLISEFLYGIFKKMTLQHKMKR